MTTTISFSIHAATSIYDGVPDCAGKFVPCNYVNDYSDSLAALRSLGIGADDAALALAGVTVGTERPTFIMLELHDPDGYFSEHAESLTAAVLLRRACGTVGLWFAMFGGKNESRDDALSYAIEQALEGKMAGSPTVDIFEVDKPERMVLQ